MNKFETFLLNFLKFSAAAAPTVAPIFIHSPQGILVFNASEALATSAIEAFHPSAPAK